MISSSVLRSLPRHGCRRLLSGRSAMDNIYNSIKARGPMTVADYTRECLLHPATGYYMQKDVIGAKGDFITSPEISQVFGELLAVWLLADWLNGGERPSCQLVELGPGMGTLAQDMFRVFSHKQFEKFQDQLSLHLVEASPSLSTQQERTLSGVADVPDITAEEVSSEAPYKSCTLDSGVKVSWYQRLVDVPCGYSYFIAHEFFDALPIHQYQRTPSGWREILVDIDKEKSPEKALRFVLAPGPTPSSVSFASLMPSGEGGEGVEVCEVCPEGMVMAGEIAKRVKEYGGAALIADYGEDGIAKNTLRGFKEHKVHDVLRSPGQADLTADVNFAVLRKAAAMEGAYSLGPMDQNEFLHKMGIRQRIEVLMKSASPPAMKELLHSYEMLTSPEHMGQRFKFFAITGSSTHLPTPFGADFEVLTHKSPTPFGADFEVLTRVNAALQCHKHYCL